MPLILQYILGFAALVFGASYAYGQAKQGKNESQIDNNNIYKDRIDALEIKVKVQSEDIEKLTEQVKQLRADNEDANRKLMDALNILQGRDPSMQAFITTMQNYIEANLPLLETVKTKVIPTVERLDKFLDKQIL